MFVSPWPYVSPAVVPPSHHRVMIVPVGAVGRVSNWLDQPSLYRTADSFNQSGQFFADIDQLSTAKVSGTSNWGFKTRKVTWNIWDARIFWSPWWIPKHQNCKGGAPPPTPRWNLVCMVNGLNYSRRSAKPNTSRQEL